MSVQVAIGTYVLLFIGAFVLGVIGNHVWLLIAAGWLVVLGGRIARLRSSKPDL